VADEKLNIVIGVPLKMQIFIQLLEGSQLNFSSPKKNHRMKAGQFKIDLTNPGKIQQSPGLGSKKQDFWAKLNIIEGNHYVLLIQLFDSSSKIGHICVYPEKPVVITVW